MRVSHHSFLSAIIPASPPARISIKSIVLLTFGLACWAMAGTANLTTASTPRQAYKGFGFSLINTERYGDLSRGQQQEISRAVIEGTGANLLRLWGSDNWVSSYINNHYLPDALAAGIDTVLMGPGGDPVAIANEIQTVKNAGYTIHYTGLMNEPDKQQGWTGAYTLSKFKELHGLLVSKSLTTRQICCEDANVDGDAKERIDAILGDAAAKSYLAAVATHSYSMGAESDYARRAFDNNKDWWMTEHSAEGVSNPTDYTKASVSSNTMLNDFNQGVTHWIYFIGYGRSNNTLPQVHNNVFLAYYDNNSFNKAVGSGWFVFSAQYHYFRQINQTFPYGTIFRRTTATGLPSSDMVWTYGTKSPINAAVGKRPDGGYGIAISNAPLNGNEDYTVNLDIAELHGTGSLSFRAMRSGPTTGFEAVQSAVTFVNGTAIVVVKASELLTLNNGTDTIIPIDPPVPDTIQLASGVLQAEVATTLSGLQSKGTSLGFGDPGDYAIYDNVDFKSGFLRVAVTYGVPADQAGNKVEFHLDSLTGPLAGTLTTQSSGGWETWRSDTVTLQGVSGVRDLYVVLKVINAGTLYIADLDKYTFLSSSSTMTSGLAIQSKTNRVPIRRLIGNQIVLQQGNAQFTIQGKRVAACKSISIR